MEIKYAVAFIFLLVFSLFMFFLGLISIGNEKNRSVGGVEIVIGYVSSFLPLMIFIIDLIRGKITIP
jgi:hypothetical protein